jgi:hypothetical protein
MVAGEEYLADPKDNGHHTCRIEITAVLCNFQNNEVQIRCGLAVSEPQHPAEVLFSSKRAPPQRPGELRIMKSLISVELLRMASRRCCVRTSGTVSASMERIPLAALCQRVGPNDVSSIVGSGRLGTWDGIFDVSHLIGHITNVLAGTSRGRAVLMRGWF